MCLGKAVESTFQVSSKKDRGGKVNYTGMSEKVHSQPKFNFDLNIDTDEGDERGVWGPIRNECSLYAHAKGLRHNIPRELINQS